MFIQLLLGVAVLWGGWWLVGRLRSAPDLGPLRAQADEALEALAALEACLLGAPVSEAARARWLPTLIERYHDSAPLRDDWPSCIARAAEAVAALDRAIYATEFDAQAALAEDVRAVAEAMHVAQVPTLMQPATAVHENPGADLASLCRSWSELQDELASLAAWAGRGGVWSAAPVSCERPLTPGIVEPLISLPALEALAVDAPWVTAWIADGHGRGDAYVIPRREDLDAPTDAARRAATDPADDHATATLLRWSPARGWRMSEAPGHSVDASPDGTLWALQARLDLSEGEPLTRDGAHQQVVLRRPTGAASWEEARRLTTPVVAPRLHTPRDGALVIETLEAWLWSPTPDGDLRRVEALTTSPEEVAFVVGEPPRLVLVQPEREAEGTRLRWRVDAARGRPSEGTLTSPPLPEEVLATTLRRCVTRARAWLLVGERWLLTTADGETWTDLGLLSDAPHLHASLACEGTRLAALTRSDPAESSAACTLRWCEGAVCRLLERPLCHNWRVVDLTIVDDVALAPLTGAASRPAVLDEAVSVVSRSAGGAVELLFEPDVGRVWLGAFVPRELLDAYEGVLGPRRPVSVRGDVPDSPSRRAP